MGADALFFKRILRKAVFPKAYKASKAMNPASGPATPAEGRVRLETAHQKFAEACRETASHRELMRTPGLALLCHLRSGAFRRKLSSIESNRRLWMT